jgi:hypothetical protein
MLPCAEWQVKLHVSSPEKKIRLNCFASNISFNTTQVSACFLRIVRRGAISLRVIWGTANFMFKRLAVKKVLPTCVMQATTPTKNCLRGSVPKSGCVVMPSLQRWNDACSLSARHTGVLTWASTTYEQVSGRIFPFSMHASIQAGETTWNFQSSLFSSYNLSTCKTAT